MKADDCGREKSIVDELNFGAKTAKRVTWEAWEFTVVGSNQVRVTNASYGYLKDDHAYVVGVEVWEGRPVPAECECPADMYHDKYDCKHKVALAAIGGPTVLKAAVEYELPATSESDERETVGTKIRADGGRPDVAACLNEEIGCAGPDSDELPCFDCFVLSEGDR